MLKLGLVVAAAFVLQILLGMMQMKHFSDEFVKLRRRGRVACGRKSGGFHAGAIVMFLIDKDGYVEEARKMEGVTCFARVRPMDGFEGKYIGTLTEADGPKGHRNLKKAIADAALSYNKFMSGEEIAQPPTPFQKVGRSASSLLPKRKVVLQK